MSYRPRGTIGSNGSFPFRLDVSRRVRKVENCHAGQTLRVKASTWALRPHLKKIVT